MVVNVIERDGHAIAVISTDETLVTSEQDALDAIVGGLFESQCDRSPSGNAVMDASL